MSGHRRIFKVFHQFIPCGDTVTVYYHYYSIRSNKLLPPSIRTAGEMVSVFQYTATAEEAAKLMESTLQYAKNKAFLKLPFNPAFNRGQLELF